ncbi:putative oxidoreductase [Actinoplanes missouriensis 431]|uniref:Putative oxidoreductase n=1 Tax=Actinoplanes missouriensis (strain ATCC 14538 / DSM 43046 / CBS 188.64 / JCM 3121 / NBRC 102363 / NCIMB 12654 / NRRL B-3342 / UNCC 431) TaxID=512565 RepID=I0HCJ3_ACTM4|nr:Gfo/Idh/MocA family oxidoreductase [Actinoplanes missouriensis]BAL90730.1 putative oxidoreductase [Actinoplanes missouriensis 431]
MTPRVALIGAGGHGLSHRRVLSRLRDAGRIEVAGLCDRQPFAPDDAASLDGVPFFTDHTALLAAVRPDVVVICTPPHTHLPIALDALACGADLLLEKPPVMSLDEHRRLTAAVAESGRLCQVGFQALGSAALARLVDAAPAGPIGVFGAWWRPDTYYRRAPWAGRRSVGGRPVFDGALVNPFAHALMQALVVAGPGFRPRHLELEAYRTRDIETDDTTFLRVTAGDGRRITVGVTLASAVFLAGEIRVGGAALEYPTDRLRLPGEETSREVPGRTGLLENLLDHRADPAVPLLAPLARTATFTAVGAAIVGSAPPIEIGSKWLVAHPEGGGSVLPGIDELVRQVATTGELPSELGAGWASRAQLIPL